MALNLQQTLSDNLEALGFGLECEGIAVEMQDFSTVIKDNLFHECLE